MTHPSDVYSEADLIGLCDALRLPHDQIGLVSEGLRQAAKFWDNLKEPPFLTAKLSDQRHEISRIQRSAAEAKSVLTNMSDAAWAAICHYDELDDPNKARAGLEFAMGSHEGQHSKEHGAIRLGPSNTGPWLTVPALIQALALIEAGAEVAPHLLPDKGPGPKVDKSLKRWMMVMHAYFIRQGWPFTRNVIRSSEAVSDAAVFCVRAYSVLSPDTPQSSILNAMKAEITDYKDAEATGRNRVL